MINTINNTMTKNESVVAVYRSHVEAEAAIKDLQKSGYDMKKLSIVGKDYHTDEAVVGYYTTGDRMLYWGKQGAFWGGFWGMLLGSAFFVIPGMGPILAGGPVVAWIVGALEEAAIIGGLTACGAGIYSIGVPKDSVLKYETAIKTGKYVLVAHGSAAEIQKARDVIAVSDSESSESYQTP